MSDKFITYISERIIDESHVKSAEQILIDNGIEEDEASTVLQAIGYALLDKELYPRKFKISNILWDKTDDDGNPVEADWLPHTVVVQSTDAEIGFPADVSLDKAEDLISEWLTEKYKFCHNGFVFEEIEEL